MNEYQDQVLWWEVQMHIWPSQWTYYSDHDSREDAEDWKAQYEEMMPHENFRVIRVTGLDAV